VKIKGFSKSVAGVNRDHNEDSILMDCASGLFIVADGVGGHLAGEVASKTAVDGIRNEIGNTKKITSGSIKEAILKANSAVYEKSVSGNRQKGMATTLVMIKFIDSGHFMQAHVGDSRLYRVRGIQITQLTDDHSWVNEQVKEGKMTAEEAMYHPKKNIIMRAMGAEKSVEPEIKKSDFRTGDKFLMCSDGLSDAVIKAEIYEALTGQDGIEAAAESLIALAQKKGSRDDISVIILEVLK